MFNEISDSAQNYMMETLESRELMSAAPTPAAHNPTPHVGSVIIKFIVIPKAAFTGATLATLTHGLG